MEREAPVPLLSHTTQEIVMTHAFEYCEFVGISTVSVEDAMKKAVEAVSATRKVAWFEVLSTRGRIASPDGTLEYQVTLKFGCKL